MIIDCNFSQFCSKSQAELRDKEVDSDIRTKREINYSSLLLADRNTHRTEKEIKQSFELQKYCLNRFLLKAKCLQTVA